MSACRARWRAVTFGSVGSFGSASVATTDTDGGPGTPPSIPTERSEVVETVVTVVTVMVDSPPLPAQSPHRLVLQPLACGVDEEPHQEAAILWRKTLPPGQAAASDASDVSGAERLARLASHPHLLPGAPRRLVAQRPHLRPHRGS